MNAHAVARERNRDLSDLYGMAATAAGDLARAAHTFDRAYRYSDPRDVLHAVTTLRAVARVLAEAVAEYELSLIPFLARGDQPDSDPPIPTSATSGA